jgi:hypothetical protein
MNEANAKTRPMDRVFRAEVIYPKCKERGDSGPMPEFRHTLFVEADDRDDAVGIVYREMNRVDGNEHISREKLKVRSMSGGDVVILSPMLKPDERTIHVLTGGSEVRVIDEATLQSWLDAEDCQFADRTLGLDFCDKYANWNRPGQTFQIVKYNEDTGRFDNIGDRINTIGEAERTAKELTLQNGQPHQRSNLYEIDKYDTNGKLINRVRTHDRLFPIQH